MKAGRPSVPFAILALLCATVLMLCSTGMSRSADYLQVVNIVDTSVWNPPSPDPSGIAFWPLTGQLVIVDGEVEETPHWRGANVFIATRTGTLVSTHSTMSFTNEPVGIDIAFDGRSSRFFIADDSNKMIYEIELGPDMRFGTADDVVRSFSTLPFGNTDPEGLTFGNGRLFTVDGAGREVYIAEPGANGLFEGANDDIISHFDVDVLDIGDPEGIEFNRKTGTLYIVDRKRRRLVETTQDGKMLRSIDLRPTGIVNPGDLAFAPSSTNGLHTHLYIADRGIDNNTDPNENDGRIYEIALTPPEPSRRMFLPWLRR